MWHIGNPFLRVIDCGHHGRSKLLESLCESNFFRRALLLAVAGFGVGGDMSVWVETAQGAVALLKDTSTLLYEWLDVVDELFFV